MSRAPRNRTLSLNTNEQEHLKNRLLRLNGPVPLSEMTNRTICQDLFEILDRLPERSVDLIFADPPYNLTKSFNGRVFSSGSIAQYEEWLESWLPRLAKVLKPTGSLYLCGDWRSSAAIHRVADRYLCVRNRITWEREKGRGAQRNWKNCSEDIWFCTVGDQYEFHVHAVKLKRRVIAPYTMKNGGPKDWTESEQGRFRLTSPSNLWTDISVPFWSMPENTDHPTQKPEKLLAKLILASSKEGDLVLDPFLGSGTTSVVCRKLNRRYIGIEIDEAFCCLAEKRLQLANANCEIQGYADGVFWERNTLSAQRRTTKRKTHDTPMLFVNKTVNRKGVV
jgi:site-specific DNA-methyltransferase (adenine-specific)